MARVQKAVNRQRLAIAIAEAESGGPLTNRSILYASVAERYNVACGAGNAKEWITPSIVMLRVQEWGMSVKTPVGKRGRPAGSKIPPKLDSAGNVIPRKKRSGRKASAENMNAMRKGEFASAAYDGLMAKIEHGSLMARIKANCLACAGFVREEVRECQCVGCPLWDVRPYRAANTPEIDESSETAEASEATLDTINPSNYALVVLN